MKWLLIVLLPLALGACVTDNNAALPMTLAPTDDAQCLRYGDAPTFGDCAKPAAATPAQAAN